MIRAKKSDTAQQVLEIKFKKEGKVKVAKKQQSLKAFIIHTNTELSRFSFIYHLIPCCTPLLRF